jgi:hypothetical protein
LFTLFMITFSLNSVSIPISYQTFSNAAYTAYQGNYQVVIEPKDIGEITVFSASARFQNLGLGFSNMHENRERRNWGSIAYHIKKVPFSIGFNGGVIKIYDQTDPLFDLGTWYHGKVSLGASFSNILNDDKILRGGISYTWHQFTAAVEIQDSLRNQEIIPHGIIAFKQPIGDFSIGLYGGLRPGQLSAAVSIDFRSFIHGMVLYEDTVKVLIGFNFRPPVVTRRITVVDTLLIDKPVIVRKTVLKNEPKPAPEQPLSEKDRQYCEKHYLKGIEHYVNDRIDDSISEWTLVMEVCPDYKDIKRYIENAREKMKLLRE